MKSIHSLKKLKLSVEEGALHCGQLWAKVATPNIVLMRLNWGHLNAGFYLCLKKQVAAQMPDVGKLQYAAHGKGISSAFAGDHRSKGDGGWLS